MPMQDEANLVSIVHDFIMGDPLLKKHINFEPDFKGHAEVIGTCYPKRKVQYAIGVVGQQDDIKAVVWVWHWTPTYSKEGELHFSRGMGPELTLHPGDPQFFEKLKAGLIKGHNSLALYHKCAMI